MDLFERGAFVAVVKRVLLLIRRGPALVVVVVARRVLSRFLHVAVFVLMRVVRTVLLLTLDGWVVGSHSDVVRG